MKNYCKRPLRLGIIGCGHVTRSCHLRAAQKVPDVDIVALVDKDTRKARALAEQYDVPEFTGDYHELFGQVDGVIIALPHHLHASVSIEFMKQGVHVLCEKPMALTVTECQAMINVAHQSARKLAIGLMRRFYNNMRLVKKMLDATVLGPVERFEAQESVIFGGFVASPFTVQPLTGGVLWDTGPHTLDLALWWFGDPVDSCYRDDAMGGVEVNCEIELTMSKGITGTIELSRNRPLSNSFRIYCRDGMLEVPTLTPDRLRLNNCLLGATEMTLSRSSEEAMHVTFVDSFASQLADFADAISRDRQPFVSGEEGMRSVRLIEQLRRTRKSLAPMPWIEFQIPQGVC